MMDQCAEFTSRGLIAEFVGEAQTDKAVISAVLDGKVQLVYITPENVIENPKFRNMLQSTVYKENLIALVVDEAHCVRMWGDQFRRAFSLIGNLRSLVPSGVKVLALTATATLDTYKCVVQRLSLQDPVLISVPPERENIVYYVHLRADLEQFTDILHKEFMELQEFPKTVVFIRKYKDCSDLYLMLRAKLGDHFTLPPKYPDISQYRRVEMFSRVLTFAKREQVLSSFSEVDSSIRLVIATTAFGLGVNVPDIRRVIHWGLPSNIEEYVQEAGRVGRDGKDSSAILYKGRGGRNSNKGIKDYSSNTSVCRRILLFSGFLSFSKNDIKVTGCKCCDICKVKCECELCDHE